MTDEPDDSAYDFETRAVGAATSPDRPTRDVVSPVHLATSFHLDEPGYPDEGYYYGRLGNPTRATLERRLARLSGGTSTVATASGTAAISAVLLATLEAGDHVVAGDSLYGGTRVILDDLVPAFGVEVSYADATDPDALAAAMRPETELCWVESPTNPLLRLCDIRAVADLTDEAGATLVVDNTFATPYGQRPLELGADVSVCSTTKFINGHTDSVGGAVTTADAELGASVRHVVEEFLGASLAPFDCYLVLRGLKTLPVRMRTHERTATELASFLDGHPAVEMVNYPGHDGHAQRALARRQLDSMGGMLSFELAADEAETRAFLERLEVCNLAMSLGGVETLVEHPATTSAAGLSPTQRAAAGIADSLVRLSVGLESAADLLADLERGLDEVVAGR